MNPPLANDKSSVRARVQAELKAISASERAAASVAICECLLAQALWRDAHSVLLFAPLKDEPNIAPLLSAALRAGKRVALPRFDTRLNKYVAAEISEPARDLVVGRFGIYEPREDCLEFSLNHLDLALVPGVAFDPCGRRLGRGQGYYDRLLASFNGVNCGVAFDVQLQAQIPAEPHDVLLHYLVTPTRWLGFAPMK